jgi:hypothetical protein
VLPAVTDPTPRSGPSGLRIITARLVGDKYYVVVEGECKTSGEFGVYIHNQDVVRVENGSLVSRKGELINLSVDFEAGSSRYLTKTVILWLGKE